MAEIPEPQNSIANLIDQHHEMLPNQRRSHLGVSTLGHPCDRFLWLSFRFALENKFTGRILRLFRRGHLEEDIIISDLEAIGIEFRKPARGQQHRVDFGCHVSGSIDGIIECGVPGAPNKPHIAEFKTHSKKSFDDVAKNGVEKSKYMHFIQMQLYMLGTGIDRSLYYAVCKDDDAIYTERIEFNKEIAQKYVDRGHRIALAERMPEPLSHDPSWWQCKMCPAHDFCFGSKKTTEANCRTCAHSTPTNDGNFFCEKYQSNIPFSAQQEGCTGHVIHPDLVPYPMKDGLDEWTAVYVINGTDVANGEPRQGVYSSKEILASPDMCASKDAVLEQLREQFGARIVK